MVVKWGNQTYNVDIAPGETVEDFRVKLFSLTNVPPDRQKIMGFKVVPLKDGTPWDKAGLKPGHKVQLIGTAGELAAPPTAEALKEEEEQKPETLEVPIGLVNLGNTCYMNSTLQCLRKIPELREGLKALPAAAPPGDVDKQMAVEARNLFRAMDSAKDAQPPFSFLTKLHSKYPQFAEKGEHGGLMQHDAEECWNAVLMSFARSVPRSDAGAGDVPSQENSLISELFQGVMETRFVCTETEAEKEVVKDEAFQKLTCNIDQKTSHMMAGMEVALSGSVEKTSEVLGRSAIWRKLGRVKQLPFYLVVQFVRFEWRQELNKGKGDKTKVVKPITFPMELDMYTLCTDQLKASMDGARKAADAARHGDDDGGVAPMDTSADHHPRRNTTGRYELVAVLSHQGRSADSGHYVSWTKYEPKVTKPGDRKDLWIQWDDDRPSYVTEDDVKRLSGHGGADWHIGYLFLYRTKQ